MEVMCKSRRSDKTDCPYIRVCFARLTDPTITGCGLPLYMAGIINKSDIMVIHTVKAEENPKPKRKRKGIHRRKGE